MRVVQLIGVCLIAAGTFIFWKQPKFHRREDVVTIGDFKASLKQEETIPPWVAGTCIGAGVLLLLVGTRKTR